MNNLGVIGGGTAGFVAALIMKARYPTMDITMVKSSKIGIIGVGEGSTEHWLEFMRFVGITHQDVIQKCGATFKSGIMFKDWIDEDYLHSVHEDFDKKTGQYFYLYGKVISEQRPQKYLTQYDVWDSTLDQRELESVEPPYNQFHFNTADLNKFLEEFAIKKGIKIIDDEILEVETSDKGIANLVGEKSNYSFDFYIDSTGMRRMLIDKLGAKWQSYSKYLKMKSAIVFPLPHTTDNYDLWTTARAMKNGWLFRIPVQTRYGNGYIFDSDYITPEQARQEVEEYFGHEIPDPRHITFDPGALDNTWIKNCVAVGLSASFVEPLEATSIGTSIQQAFMLMHRIINYTDISIKRYNKDVNALLDNIRDFVVLHYQTKRTDSEFWKDVQKMPLPESLQENLNHWKQNLPISEDFNHLPGYVLFRDQNFLHILHGLKLFDYEKIREEYLSQNPVLLDIANKELKQIYQNIEVTPKISHKKFIDLVKLV